MGVFIGIDECHRDHQPRVQQVRQDPIIEKSGVRSGVCGTSDHENRPREIQGADHENIGVQTVIRRRWMLPTNKWKARRIASPQKSRRIDKTNNDHGDEAPARDFHHQRRLLSAFLGVTHLRLSRNCPVLPKFSRASSGRTSSAVHLRHLPLLQGSPRLGPLQLLGLRFVCLFHYASRQHQRGDWDNSRRGCQV